MTKTPKKRKSWQEKLEDSKDLPRIEVGDEMIDDTALRSSGVRMCRTASSCFFKRFRGLLSGVNILRTFDSSSFIPTEVKLIS